VAAAAKPAEETPPPPPSPPDAAAPARPDAAPPLEAAPAPVARKQGKVLLHHHNEMGSSFHLVRIAYVLDGIPAFDRQDPNGQLDEPRDLDALTRLVELGQHKLQVLLEYKGAAHGLFTYTEGYRFKVQSSYTFTVNPDRVTEVTIRGYEKGGVNTALENRPAVDFQSRSR
jgi:hypothetical protein